MNKKEHDEAVASLKEICREIGCSRLSPAMCDHAPQKCGIIRKLVMADSSPDIIPASVAGSQPRQRYKALARLSKGVL